MAYEESMEPEVEAGRAITATSQVRLDPLSGPPNGKRG